MNQRNSVNLIIVLVVIVLGSLAYFVYTVRPEENVLEKLYGDKVNGNNVSNEENWEKLIPEIAEEAKSRFSDLKIEESFVNIYKKADLNKNGKDEALVTLGPAGAYTSYISLMEIENDKPNFIRFKQKNGEISPILFLTGASVKNELDAIMAPEKNAVYGSSYSVNDFQKVENCEVDAYKWSDKSKIFEFDENLSKEFKESYCAEVKKRVEGENENTPEIIFSTVLKGEVGGEIKNKNYLITKEKDFENIWNFINKNITPKPAMPKIDFNKEAVIAAFQGEKPTGGYGVEIVKIIEDSGAVNVLIKEKSPGVFCAVPEVITSPYHLVKIEKTEKKFDFRTQEEISKCE